MPPTTSAATLSIPVRSRRPCCRRLWQIRLPGRNGSGVCRWAALGRWTISPTGCCIWSPMNRPSSPGVSWSLMGAQPLSESATLSSLSRVRGAASGSFRGQGVTEGSNSFSPKVFAQFIGVCSRPTVVVALTPRTLERPILPAQHMDGGLTRFGVEEVVQMRNHRHGRAAPWITGSVKNRSEDSQLTIEGLRCYKPREIERNIFAWHGQMPVKGLKKCQMLALGAILLYQIVLLYQHQRQQPVGVGIKALLRAA